MEPHLMTRVASKQRFLSESESAFQTKLLNHNPEIYAQFGKFELKPPATTKDVVSVIEALKEKQVRIELERISNMLKIFYIAYFNPSNTSRRRPLKRRRHVPRAHRLPPCPPP